ncbi:tRNA epoxyqueuosine(34) reductase QueG [Spongiibacter sp. KMU-158]|uniref:Epoxyqueuosine reductase n=2 Tax=Spongiibacter pelagi TaxID=2760804 RepID=A0A927GV10_9GAMM|nr:tRNA epoxyqueuosine(34) reductase QueG [Spongiibacter pelagi]
MAALAADIKRWGEELGFANIGIAPATPGIHAERLQQWLSKQYHGEMGYMQERENLRREPDQLQTGTVRIISARMDYLPSDEPAQGNPLELINNKPDHAYISRYALGRDYHKLIRKRLSQLAQKIEERIGGQHRAFVDSAPVLERGFAEQAGLGWIGKNSMLINQRAGSWFFLGEIYTSAPLPLDPPQESGHCGSCSACIKDCPTGAIVAPYQVDARRCISYLTIELKDSIPEELRPKMGNRVFGCDDCQLVCPWNKFTEHSPEPDFQPRHNLDNSELITLFMWSEAEFEQRTAGSPIRRIGYQRWLRNLAVGLGNAPYSERIVTALETQRAVADDNAREHIDWALTQQRSRI